MISNQELIDGFNGVKNTRTNLELTEPRLSERAVFIINKLAEMGLSFSVEGFVDRTLKGVPLYFYNIIVPVIKVSDSVETILLTAHHDILNIKSNNINDNTASVVNLLMLAQRLKAIEQVNLDKNITICFTDCEELFGKGAEKLSLDINQGKFGDVDFILNLELTAHGKNIWIEKVPSYAQKAGSLSDNLKQFLGLGNYEEAGIPFADSFIFSKYNNDSVTIGTLPDIKFSAGRRYDYSVWNICHSIDDTLYNIDDMNNFTSFIFSFIMSESNGLYNPVAKQQSKNEFQDRHIIRKQKEIVDYVNLANL